MRFLVCKASNRAPFKFDCKGTLISWFMQIIGLVFNMRCVIFRLGIVLCLEKGRLLLANGAQLMENVYFCIFKSAKRSMGLFLKSCLTFVGVLSLSVSPVAAQRLPRETSGEIGRASCRERV